MKRVLNTFSICSPIPFQIVLIIIYITPILRNEIRLRGKVIVENSKMSRTTQKYKKIAIYMSSFSLNSLVSNSEHDINLLLGKQGVCSGEVTWRCVRGLGHWVLISYQGSAISLQEEAAVLDVTTLSHIYSQLHLTMQFICKFLTPGQIANLICEMDPYRMPLGSEGNNVCLLQAGCRTAGPTTYLALGFVLFSN